jgi:nitric oxide dioxygenase
MAKEKNTVDLLKLIEYPKSGILSNVIVKNNNLDVTLFCMSKGSEMTEHTSTRMGTVQVLEGDGIFTLKGKKIMMKPGVIIFMDKKDVHALKANKNTSFLLTLTD